MVEVLEMGDECNCIEMRIENDKLKGKLSDLMKKNEEIEENCSNVYKTMKNAAQEKSKEMDSLKRKMRYLEASKSVLETKLKLLQEASIPHTSSDVSIIYKLQDHYDSRS